MKNNIADLTIDVSNIFGQTILSGQFKNASGTVNWNPDLKNVTAGMYLVRIFENKTQVYHQKVIKK